MQILSHKGTFGFMFHIHISKIDMKNTFRYTLLVLVVLIHKCTLSRFHEAIETKTVEVEQDEGVVCLFLLVPV